MRRSLPNRKTPASGSHHPGQGNQTGAIELGVSIFHLEQNHYFVKLVVICGQLLSRTLLVSEVSAVAAREI